VRSQFKNFSLLVAAAQRLAAQAHNRPSLSYAATARCLKRAAEAAERGDVLETQYWQSAAAAAQRRQLVQEAPKPSLRARLLQFVLTPVAGQERVA
jgi:enoyl-CoA hydratase/carnithine racemase